jgi:hypothetical protein
MRRKKSHNIKNRKTKEMLCMNSDPENSKWGLWAPPGGCDNIVKNVDQEVTRVLCSRCTMRAADNRRIH